MSDARPEIGQFRFRIAIAFVLTLIYAFVVWQNPGANCRAAYTFQSPRINALIVLFLFALSFWSWLQVISLSIRNSKNWSIADATGTVFLVAALTIWTLWGSCLCFIDRFWETILTNRECNKYEGELVRMPDGSQIGLFTVERPMATNNTILFRRRELPLFLKREDCLYWGYCYPSATFKVDKNNIFLHLKNGERDQKDVLISL